MKLDRNINPQGKGKYALIKLRVASPLLTGGGQYATVPANAVDYGDSEDSEFFVIRLKDRHAAAALRAYAEDANANGDEEFAREVLELSIRAMEQKNRKLPD